MQTRRGSFLDYNQIQAGIYLGNLAAAKDEELLNELNIKAILTIDIYSLPDEITRQLTYYLHINLKDDPKDDLISRLDSSFKFIQKCLNEKQNLFVHCVAGISRSASILIAYFMKMNQLSFDRAFELVKKKRDKICCNDGFKQQLTIYQAMNYQLDANYRPFRLQQLAHLADSFNYYFMDSTNSNSTDEIKRLLHNYLARFHNEANLNSAKIIFKCKKCRFYLFNDLNVLINSTTNNPISNDDYKTTILNTNCNSIFVEPLASLKDELIYSKGNINCTKCSSKLGYFNWYCNDYCCEPHSKILPALKVDMKKIDHQLLNTCLL